MTVSTNHCIFLTYGMPRQRISEMDARRTAMAAAVTAVHSKALDVIFSRAQIAIVGALITMDMALPTNCCI